MSSGVSIYFDGNSHNINRIITIFFGQGNFIAEITDLLNKI